MQFTWVLWYDLVTFTGSWDTKGIERGAYTNVAHIHNTSLPGKGFAHTDLTNFMIHQELPLSLVELLPVSVNLRRRNSGRGSAQAAHAVLKRLPLRCH
jgi:hypothetical protein